METCNFRYNIWDYYICIFEDITMLFQLLISEQVGVAATSGIYFRMEPGWTEYRLSYLTMFPILSTRMLR
jgi:hypothetical protein